MIKKIIKLVLVLIIMFTIFSFSSENDTESNSRSDGVIVKTCEFILNRKLTEKEKELYIEKYVTVVRKTAHFTIYFLLGLAFASFLKEFDLDTKKILLYTVLFVFLYACSDECHQLFIRGRSGEILDVLIDTSGGFISSFIYTSFIKRRKLNG